MEAWKAEALEKEPWLAPYLKEEWLVDAYKKMHRMPEKAKEIKEIAEDDLWTFAQLVNPTYMYGDIHKEVYRWLQKGIEEGWDNLGASLLILLPRGHLKSHIMATSVAWIITKKPDTSVLYLSATSTLAEKQLYDIKNIITGPSYSRYWPNMVNPEEGKREKWTSKEICIDHPLRKREVVRDPTIASAGLTTNTTGWHADIIVPDDVVVPENAYTEDGRDKVSAKMSQMESIQNAGGMTLACGTRYHPSDIYDLWKKQTTDLYDEETFEILERNPTWNIKEHVVEVDNIYLWPRELRDDGKSFGFNINVLSRIKSKYSDITQFYAQYYNDPNDQESQKISKDKFQYADEKHLKWNDGWRYNGKKLNIYASIDFAFSLKKRADYTAIVVIGINSERDIFVVDIDRFKSDKIAEYFDRIKELHSKWGFKKLRAEVTVAQAVIVSSIKDFIKEDGMRLMVDEFRPGKAEGRKEERIAAALEHRYDNGAMYHFKGGYTRVLEEELVMARPPHDDVKDALASAVEIAVPPARSRNGDKGNVLKFKPHSRFGGFG